MSDPRPRELAVLKGRNNVPTLEKFEGLFLPEGTETARIRFRVGRDRLLDLPLSAEALADLVQLLCGLRGFSPEKVAEGIAEARALGLFSED